MRRRFSAEAQYPQQAPKEFAQLSRITRYVNEKGIVYKTVDTFAGITKRKLWVVNAAKAATNGHEIRVPLSDPHAYRLTEHELSHILFRSDGKAKSMFIQKWTEKILETVKKQNLAVDKNMLAEVVGQIINVVEDHRVDKLWGMLYPGSYVLKKQMDCEYIEPLRAFAQESLLVYMSCLEAGIDPGEGPNDRFKPYIVEALRKVENRGFRATLVVSKWLVTMLVNEIIRESQGESPPAPQQEETIIVVLGGGGASGQGTPGEGGEQHGEGSSAAGDQEQEGQNSDGQTNQGGDPGDAASVGGGGGGAQPWEPPDVNATPEQRVSALQNLIDRLNSKGHQRPLDDDVEQPKFQDYKARKQTNDTVEASVQAQVNNSDKLEKHLQKSAEEMEKILEEARTALRKPIDTDEWIRKDAMARLVFKDVRKRDVPSEIPCPNCGHRSHVRDRCTQCGGTGVVRGTIPLLPEDQDAVRRLRGIFNRILGKKKTELTDTGSEINPQAYIEAKLTGTPVPCFIHQEMGRGFKALVLLDRSSSMQGGRTKQAERACRILNRALRYPFVELTVWGFQSLEDGQVDISRYDPDLEVFDAPHAHVGGVTPLHVAVRVGAKQLDRGNESKQLFVITDGMPVYARRDGKQFGDKQLQFFVREDVRKARRRGINVTAALIMGGSYLQVPSTILAFMFGSAKSWRVVSEDRFGSDLVNLVTSSFINYLKTL